MATTPNWGIVYPTVGSQLTPLANVFSTMASSVDTALVNRDTSRTINYSGLAINRTAITAKAGDTYLETDGSKYLWRYNGTAWENVTPGVGTANRETSQSVTSTMTYSKMQIGAGATSGVVTFNDSNDEFTVLANGFYSISGAVSYATNSSGRRVVAIYKNGAYNDLINVAEAVSGNSTIASVTGTVQLAANDKITLMSWQNSGTTISSNRAFLSVTRVGL